MSQIIRIYSENDKFQLMNSLKTNRQRRQKQKEFLLEGVRHINNAIKYKWHIKAFVYSTDIELSGWAKEVLKDVNVETHYQVSVKVLEKLSNKEVASELLAIIQIPQDNLTRIPVKDNMLVVVFDRPSSQGNLGSLIRSCDALGVDAMVITGRACDLYDPETISATTGSIFSFPVIRLESHKEVMDWIKKIKTTVKDIQIVGTDEKGSIPIYEYSFKKPTILLAGNETWGLSAAYKELSNALVRIPIQGSASSLNVTSATSIVLYEINRQRREF